MPTLFFGKRLVAAAGVVGLVAIGSLRPAMADVYVTDVAFSVGNTSNEDTVYIWGNGFSPLAHCPLARPVVAKSTGMGLPIVDHHSLPSTGRRQSHHGYS